MMTSLRMAGTSDCLLPKDRIRGILALANDPNFAGIEAKDWLDIATVYTKFSGHLLSTVESRNLGWWRWLSLAFTVVRDADLPSWVPDFHHQDAEHTCKPYRRITSYRNWYGGTYTCQYQASKMRSMPVMLGKQRNEIVLRGKILDEVREVFDRIPAQPPANFDTDLAYQWCVSEWEEDIADTVLSRGRGVDDECPSGGGKIGQRSISLDTFWRTLIGNMTEQREGSITVDTYQRWRTRCKRIREVAAKHDLINKYVPSTIAAERIAQILTHTADCRQGCCCQISNSRMQKEPTLPSTLILNCISTSIFAFSAIGSCS